MIGSPPITNDKYRILQIGGSLEEVGEDEINDMIEAIGRSRADLNLGGTNWVESQRIHGEGSSHGALGSHAKLGHASGVGGQARTSEMAWIQASGRCNGAGVGTRGAVLGEPRQGPLLRVLVLD